MLGEYNSVKNLNPSRYTHHTGNVSAHSENLLEKYLTIHLHYVEGDDSAGNIRIFILIEYYKNV
jgi:hypothetical protein